MDASANEAQPAPSPQRKSSFATWTAYVYFAVALTAIVADGAYQYRLIRIDARVHRVMTSASSITIDQVKESLSDVIKNGNEFPGTDDHLHFGTPDQRSLFITYDVASGVVTDWYMLQVSDQIDTERAADGRATLWLLKFYGTAFLIVFSPLPFLWRLPRVSKKPLKISFRIAYVILMVPSVGVALLTGIATAVMWAGY